MKRDTGIAIIVIILVVIFVIVMYLFLFTNLIPGANGSQKCNYNSTTKAYIKTNPEECKVINFLCVLGKKPFVDECGCGCETINVNETYNYCKDSDRNADVCLTIYQPVCGWFNPDKIQCIKYPCAKTFSNSCFACKNENVLYWTDGDCLK